MAVRFRLGVVTLLSCAKTGFQPNRYTSDAYITARNDEGYMMTTEITNDGSYERVRNETAFANCLPESGAKSIS